MLGSRWPRIGYEWFFSFSFLTVGKYGVHIEIAQQTQTNQTIDTDMCISAVRIMELAFARRNHNISTNVYSLLNQDGTIKKTQYYLIPSIATQQMIKSSRNPYALQSRLPNVHIPTLQLSFYGGFNCYRDCQQIRATQVLSDDLPSQETLASPNNILVLGM